MTGTVSVATFAGCGWSAGTTNSWISILSGATGSGNGTVTYAVAANTNSSTRTGAVVIAGQAFAISQNPALCNYNLSPTTRSHGYAMAIGTVSMTASGTCPWTAATTNNWITLKSPFSGSGNGSFTYVVAANTNGFQRIGYITAADDFLTITQKPVPCVYSIVPSNRSHGYAAATGIVTVTTSGGCAWSVVNTNSWISILTGTNGVNVGDITYAVTANTSGISRSGVVAIADQIFTVNQSSGVCSYTVTPLNINSDGIATNGTISVGTVSGCPWSATSTNTWISINGGTGAGSGTPNFSLSANLGQVARTGAIMVAGQQVTITQPVLPPCDYKISPVNRIHGAGAASNYVTLITSNYCPWNVVNTNSWVTIVNAGGTGGTNIGYLVAANPSTGDRTGTVVIAGQVMTLVQGGVSCSYSISPTNRSHGYAPTSNDVALTTSGTNCAWNVVNTNNWIIIPTTNGVGSALISYSLVTNASYTGRTGTVLVSGQPLTIVQRGIGCPFDLAPESRSHGYSPATNSIGVNAGNTCSWTVINTNSWLTILSSPNGVGNGTVTYSVASNSNVGSRTGYLQIGDQVFTLVQGGIGCEISLSPSTRNHGYGAATNSFSMTVNAGCAWMVVKTNDWITLLSAATGSGNATITYAVASNPSASPRSGNISIGDENFSMTQAGAPCTYTAVPDTFSFDAGAFNGFFSLNTPIGCPWVAVNTNNWINFTSSMNGSSNAVLSFTANLNPSSNARTGTVAVGGITVTISQAGMAPCAYRLSPTNRIHGAGAASNSVGIVTQSYCPWTVVNTNSWITITTGLNGAGSTNLGYVVAANPAFSERTGAVVVAGQVLTLIQSGATCDYSLSPTDRTHGFGAATNSINVTADARCAWTVVNTNSWVSILSGATGTGPGIVTYSVVSNGAFADRTGTVIIAGLPFTLSQNGLSCFDLSPSARTHGYSGSSGIISVTSISNCQWTVVNTNPWVSFTSTMNGVGNSTLSYMVASNSSVIARTGVVMIADQPFTVLQNGFNCNFKISPVTRTHGFGMATNTISITASPNCTWNVVNPSSWITITAGASGMGNGTSTYTVAPNFSAQFRTGQVMVADQVLTITQKPVEPFAFDYLQLPSGQVDLRLSGGPSGAWDIEASTDLVHWQKLASVTNTTGSVEYLGTPATNSYRFYRAIQTH